MSKAVFAFLGALATGAGFLVTAGVLHGAALIGTQAGIVAADALLTSYGVSRIPNGSQANVPTPAVPTPQTVHSAGQDPTEKR